MYIYIYIYTLLQYSLPHAAIHIYIYSTTTYIYTYILYRNILGMPVELELHGMPVELELHGMPVELELDRRVSRLTRVVSDSSLETRDSSPPKKLLACGFSTPYPVACFISTMDSELTSIPDVYH